MGEGGCCYGWGGGWGVGEVGWEMKSMGSRRGLGFHGWRVSLGGSWMHGVATTWLGCPATFTRGVVVARPVPSVAPCNYLGMTRGSLALLGIIRRR